MAITKTTEEDIKAHEINLKAVAASANKCLHGAPGLAFVLAHKDQWEKTADKSYGVYFDLHQYYGMQKRDGFSPYTQATHLVSAFHEALLEFTEMGGWKARNALFHDRAEQIHDCLKSLDILTAPELPKEDNEEKIIEASKKENSDATLESISNPKDFIKENTKAILQGGKVCGKYY